MLFNQELGKGRHLTWTYWWFLTWSLMYSLLPIHTYFFRLYSYKKREYAVLHLQVNLYYSQQPGCIYSKKLCPRGHIKKACYVIKTTSMTLWWIPWSGQPSYGQSSWWLSSLLLCTLWSLEQACPGALACLSTSGVWAMPTYSHVALPGRKSQ